MTYSVSFASRRERSSCRPSVSHTQVKLQALDRQEKWGGTQIEISGFHAPAITNSSEYKNYIKMRCLISYAIVPMIMLKALRFLFQEINLTTLPLPFIKYIKIPYCLV